MARAGVIVAKACTAMACQSVTASGVVKLSV
jgi:hypothetical protein